MVFPKKQEIFRAFDECKLEKLKVLILGQDPYHSENMADGLAFSASKSKKMPPSLRNIYKSIENSGFKMNFDDYDLGHLAKQGVMLLNTSLTVEKNNANSHKDIGWEIFTDNVIKKINSINSPICIMLWGKNAEKKSSLLTNQNHLVIKTSHPSPFSARISFNSSKQFLMCNKFLRENSAGEINWSNAWQMINYILTHT